MVSAVRGSPTDVRWCCRRSLETAKVSVLLSFMRWKAQPDYRLERRDENSQNRLVQCFVKLHLGAQLPFEIPMADQIGGLLLCSLGA
jgi:hypothetical protein